MPHLSTHNLESAESAGVFRNSGGKPTARGAHRADFLGELRLGTPAMTTRGFKAEQAIITANLIADVLDQPRDEATLDRVRAEEGALARRYPVYELPSN
jgi:glycine/serine hydroxymethyltransferase